MRRVTVLVTGASAIALALTLPVFAQDTKVAVGLSGWTGFAPLTLAKEAGFFKKHGLSVKDVTVVNLEPGPAAQAFVAGQNDAAMTYEPYLSTVRSNPSAGKIIATTLDYPMIMDTFGCTPKFLADNPKAAKALADSYFDVIDLIAKEPKKSFEIMGADVKQTGEQFEASQKYLRWQDRAANRKFFEGELRQFSKEAADLLLEIGIIKQVPDLNSLADTRFIQ